MVQIRPRTLRNGGLWRLRPGPPPLQPLRLHRAQPCRTGQGGCRVLSQRRTLPAQIPQIPQIRSPLALITPRTPGEGTMSVNDRGICCLPAS